MKLAVTRSETYKNKIFNNVQSSVNLRYILMSHLWVYSSPFLCVSYGEQAITSKWKRKSFVTAGKTHWPLILYLLLPYVIFRDFDILTFGLFFFFSFIFRKTSRSYSKEKGSVCKVRTKDPENFDEEVSKPVWNSRH
jgi:hypothetical protein